MTLLLLGYHDGTLSMEYELLYENDSINSKNTQMTSVRHGSKLQKVARLLRGNRALLASFQCTPSLHLLLQPRSDCNKRSAKLE